MIDKDDENPEPGLPKIPGAGGAGTAGPSRNVSQDEQAGAGPENGELEWARRNVSNDIPDPLRARKVLRKTELHGKVRNREDARKFRKQILLDLRDTANDEAVTRFGTVLREFIDTIIERQNRIEDTLLLQIAELGQRADDLEQRIMERGRTAPEKPEVSG